MNVPFGHKLNWSRLPVKSLLMFESVVRHKSVTKAGEEFSVTHSAVSKNLSILEDYLGYDLFDRTSRNMQATSEAELLASAIREAEGLIEGALHNIAGRKTAIDLDVLAPATFAMRWLIPRLPDFTSGNAHLHPKVRPTHTPDDLLSLSFDIAIRRGDDMPENYIRQPLFSETMGLVATAPVAERLRRNGFFAGDLICADTRPGELADWLEATGLKALASHDFVSYPHNYIALEAVLAGAGAMVMPLEIIEQSLADRRLVQVFSNRTTRGKTYFAGYDPRSPKRTHLQVFVLWLASQTDLRSAA